MCKCQTLIFNIFYNSKIILVNSLLAFIAKYGVLTNQWTWLYEALLEVSMTKIALSVADLGGGARGVHPPRRPNSFNFMQFSGKFYKIVCWHPPGELAPPWGIGTPLGKSWIQRWLWIRVCADDWAAESVIKASNVESHFSHLHHHAGSSAHSDIENPIRIFWSPRKRQNLLNSLQGVHMFVIETRFSISLKMNSFS